MKPDEDIGLLNKRSTVGPVLVAVPCRRAEARRQAPPYKSLNAYSNRTYFVSSRDVVFATTVRNFAEFAIHSFSCGFVPARSRKAASRSDEGVTMEMRCE